MTATIFANFGVLSREYRTVYTASEQHAHAVCSDKITVIIPDEFAPYMTVNDQIAVTIGKYNYLLDEVLSTAPDSAPCFRWSDGSGEHWHKLEIAKEAAE